MKSHACMKSHTETQTRVCMYSHTLLRHETRAVYRAAGPDANSVDSESGVAQGLTGTGLAELGIGRPSVRPAELGRM